MFITTSAISAALPSEYSPAAHRNSCSLQMCFSLPVYGTVALSVDWLLLMMCNQSDSSVGGTLSETT